MSSKHSVGPPTIRSLFLRRNSVICISKGQLIDQVVWYKNKLKISHSRTDYIQQHVLRDTTTVEYEHRLIAKTILTLRGGYITCKLTDGIGRSVQRIIQLPGW